MDNQRIPMPLSSHLSGSCPIEPIYLIAPQGRKFFNCPAGPKILMVLLSAGFSTLDIWQTRAEKAWNSADLQYCSPKTGRFDGWFFDGWIFYFRRFDGWFKWKNHPSHREKKNYAVHTLTKLLNDNSVHD